jgi:hypothetical protein
MPLAYGPGSVKYFSLRYNGVQFVERQPTLRRNISLPSSESRNERESSWKAGSKFYLVYSSALNIEVAMFLRNVA